MFPLNRRKCPTRTLNTLYYVLARLATLFPLGLTVWISVVVDLEVLFPTHFSLVYGGGDEEFEEPGVADEKDGAPPSSRGPTGRFDDPDMPLQKGSTTAGGFPSQDLAGIEMAKSSGSTAAVFLRVPPSVLVPLESPTLGTRHGQPADGAVSPIPELSIITAARHEETAAARVAAEDPAAEYQVSASVGPPLHNAREDDPDNWVTASRGPPFHAQDAGAEHWAPRRGPPPLLAHDDGAGDREPNRGPPLNTQNDDGEPPGCGRDEAPGRVVHRPLEV